MTGKLLVGFGVYLAQDGVASICFYPTERWRWNHLMRLVRICIGIALIILGAIE